MQEVKAERVRDQSDIERHAEAHTTFLILDLYVTTGAREQPRTYLMSTLHNTNIKTTIVKLHTVVCKPKCCLPDKHLVQPELDLFA